MTTHIFPVLIAAIWVAFAIAAKRDLDAGGFGTGLRTMLLFPCAVAATLAVLLVRAWGWL